MGPRPIDAAGCLNSSAEARPVRANRELGLILGSTCAHSPSLVTWMGLTAMHSLLAYVGPETTVSLMSLLAVIGGILMMVGGRIKHYCVAFVRRLIQR